jgi:hypothetical protein
MAYSYFTLFNTDKIKQHLVQEFKKCKIQDLTPSVRKTLMPDSLAVAMTEVITSPMVAPSNVLSISRWRRSKRDNL